MHGRPLLGFFLHRSRSPAPRRFYFSTSAFQCLNARLDVYAVLLVASRFISPHASAMSTTNTSKEPASDGEVVGPLVAVAQLTATSDHAQNFEDAAVCAQEVRGFHVPNPMQPTAMFATSELSMRRDNIMTPMFTR